MSIKFLKSFLISLVIFITIGSYFLFISEEGIPTILADENIEIEQPQEIVSVDKVPDDIEIDSEDLKKYATKNITAFKNNEITFLMVGVDTLQKKEYSGIRTDTIMVVKCNFDSGKLKILSIPRDTRLKVKGSLDKINHAHSYGGMDLTMKTINNFLDTDIKYYVKIDYRAVQEVVDAIGGVDIYVPRRMEYYDPTVNFRVDLKKGQQILDGDKSMQFLRWRSNNAMTLGYREGDVGRIGTQQYFLKEFVKQTLQPKNITKLPKIVQTYFKRVDTNIPIKHMLSGVSLAKDLDTENIETEIVPGYGTYIDDVSYYIVYNKKLETLIQEMGLRDN